MQQQQIIGYIVFSNVNFQKSCIYSSHIIDMTVIVTFILAWGRYISNAIQFLLCTHHLASPFIFVCIIRQFNISSKPDLQFARLYDTIIIYYLYSSMVVQLENRVVKWQFFLEFCIWRIAIFARFFCFCLCLKKKIFHISIPLQWQCPSRLYNSLWKLTTVAQPCENAICFGIHQFNSRRSLLSVV